MVELVWRNAIYYLLLFLRRPLVALMPGLLTLVGGTYLALNFERPFYSEGLLIIDFQQISSSLVSPTVANDRLRFIDQRVLSRDNLVSLADRFDLYPDLPETVSEAAIATMVRSNITLQTNLSEGSDGLASATVLLGFKHTSASTSAAVADALIHMVIEENRRIRTSQASETTKFLQREVEELSARLKLKEEEWSRLGPENQDAQPSRLPTMLIELQGREDELSTVQQTLAASEEEIKLLDAQLRAGLDATSPRARLKDQIAALDAEIAEAHLLYTDEHPQLRLLKQRAAEMKRAYDTASTAAAPAVGMLPPDLALIAERLNQARPRHEAATSRRADLATKIAQLKNSIALATEAEGKLTIIEADRQSLQRSLDEMKGRLSTALMGERLELKNVAFQVDILERPTVPKNPSGPRRLLLLAGVLLASAAIGTGTLVASDLLDQRVRGTFDLNEALEGRTLVLVPDWKPPRPVKALAR